MNENYSALGDNPVCQKCHKRIQVGQEVFQSFQGVTFQDINDGNPDKNPELLLSEEMYVIHHVTCNPEIEG